MTQQIFAPQLFDHGSVGAGTTTPELVRGLYHRVTCTAATRTIGAPVVNLTSRVSGQDVDVATPVTGPGGPNVGTQLLIEIRNTSGGALTCTWNAIFKGAPGNPANGQRRIHQFLWDGANWCLMNNAADVPN